MRFILNFFLFGFLFYLISVFFPEAFGTLVAWASGIYGFLHDIVMGIVNQVHDKKVADAEEVTHAISTCFKISGFN